MIYIAGFFSKATILVQRSMLLVEVRFEQKNEESNINCTEIIVGRAKRG